MVLVLVLAAGIWFLGVRLGATLKARWLMLALLYVVLLAISFRVVGFYVWRCRGF
jgi:hypothetical protein